VQSVGNYGSVFFFKLDLHNNFLNCSLTLKPHIHMPLKRYTFCECGTPYVQKDSYEYIIITYRFVQCGGRQSSLHSRLNKFTFSLNLKMAQVKVSVALTSRLSKTREPPDSKIWGAAATCDFGLNENLIPISDAVGMEGPSAALQLLRSHDRRHLPADEEEPDPAGGQLQQSSDAFP